MTERALPGWVGAGEIDGVPLWRRTSEPVYVAAADRDQLAFLDATLALFDGARPRWRRLHRTVSREAAIGRRCTGTWQDGSRRVSTVRGQVAVRADITTARRREASSGHRGRAGQGIPDDT
jgi:hypothetical protein